jgi:hypothetical protein
MNYLKYRPVGHISQKLITAVQVYDIVIEIIVLNWCSNGHWSKSLSG